MEVLTLRTGNPDTYPHYSQMSSVVTYIKAYLTGSGIPDHITVEVQGGALFGTKSTLWNFGAASVNWNNKEVTFRTLPAEQATPATILGGWTTGGGSGTSGKVTTQNIILGSNSAPGIGALFNENFGHASFINCLMVMESNVGIVAGTTSSDTVTKNCTIVSSGGATGVNITGGLTRKPNTTNNIVVVFATGTVLTTGTALGSYVNCYNYGTGGVSVSTPDTGTNTVDPLTTQQLIQSSSDTIETILARNAKLLASSPCLLQGNNVVPSDIIGTTRTSQAIGAYFSEPAPVLCWNYKARYKSTSRLYTANGGGRFPSELKVPRDVDSSSGIMIDEGKLISPDQFKIIQ